MYVCVCGESIDLVWNLITPDVRYNTSRQFVQFVDQIYAKRLNQIKPALGLPCAKSGHLAHDLFVFHPFECFLYKRSNIIGAPAAFQRFVKRLEQKPIRSLSGLRSVRKAKTVRGSNFCRGSTPPICLWTPQCRLVLLIIAAA